MTITRSYTFKDSSGELHVLTLSEAAKKSSDPAIMTRIKEITLNLQNRRTRKDGFEPGFQANTGKYAGGRKEYDKQLKDMGLVEIGYDYVPQESVGDYNFCQTDEFIDACVESGIELSDGERSAIKSGEYYKDIEISD